MPDPDNIAAITPAHTPAVERQGVGALLFTAGEGGPEPLSRFLREDAPGLDWRQDFLRSAKVDRLFEAMEGSAPGDDDEGEDEIVFYRSELVTTGSMQNIEDTEGM